MNDSEKFHSPFPVFHTLTISLYVILISVGLIAGVCVLRVLITVLRCGLSTCVYVYTLGLVVIDLVFLLFRLLTLDNLIRGSWMFGGIVCSAYQYYEGVHTCALVLTLVGVTGDRFLGICRPSVGHHYRTERMAFAYVCLSVLSALLLNFPLLLFAEVTEIEVGERRNGSHFICYLNFPYLSSEVKENGTHGDYDYDANEDYNLEDYNIQLVASSVWKNYGTYQTLLTFLIAHVIPGVIIVKFTLRISSQLQLQQLRFRRLWEERKKASRVTLAVLILYFVCWTPYWFVRLISIFARFGVHGDQLVAKISIFCYSLPVLNASLNSIMYGFLNKSLAENYRSIRLERLQHRVRHSMMLLVNQSVQKRVSVESEMETNLINISFLSGNHD